ncbi:DNA polymerase IV [Nocardia nova]|uniref:DNA polymerase IV n=1 Tax=Nocardia nova TaxID=37330 RepID=A0A2S6AV05_9NOCA|nr:DNA polymerase IV [Nocardia nova]PPJ32450.1 DNA polymerase IV [Nocardia nova]PPJ39040.1 DNA polymerase IV [Nocardia nova]
MARWLLHVDLDQFQAAVEFRRHPELRGQPVIVGGNGDPNEPRKVVTCASYPARAFGVRAGMPLRTAVRKCPDGVFLPLDMTTYEEASDEVMEVLRSFPVRVEVLGWDEAFLAADTDDPEQLAREIRSAIVELNLTCSIGIGDNKLRAKLATGFAKSVGKGTAAKGPNSTAAKEIVGQEHSHVEAAMAPRIADPGMGIFRLTAENWNELMAHRPTSALWGIGNRIAQRMSALGIDTVAQLAAADRNVLAAEFGPTTGPYLWVLGHGAGDTDVVTEPRIPVGRSKSETFPHDLTEREEIRAQVARLAREVAEEMAAAGRIGTRVGVTVRTNTFYTRTKQKKLPEPTIDAEAIIAVALEIIDRFELDRPVRLLGVRLELVPR